MFDMHSHILPSVDDGAEFFEEALEMVDIAVQNGTTSLVLTPHYIRQKDHHGLSVTDLSRAYMVFSKEISAEFLSLSLYFGAENFISNLLEQQIAERDLITLNDTRYLLIEFDFAEQSGFIQRAVQQLLDAGYRPIIAHPERYECLYRNSSLLQTLVKKGCLFQINAGSPFGMYGTAAEALSYWMLQHRLVHCVGSDAHSPYYRTPNMSDVRAFVSLHFSKEYSKQIFLSNPERILKGEAIVIEEDADL